jgi:hypothetical protein
MKFNLRYIYIFTLLSSLLASFYSLVVPGISKPIFPSGKMRENLLQLDLPSLESFKKTDNAKDSSDRKLSSIYHYRFSDGSDLYATLVTVRKRDDFKIETYGLLTKGISELYIKNPRMTNSVPYSIYGLINNRDALQTCIIPGTAKLDQVDIRLSSLTASVKNLNTSASSIPSKLLGIEEALDYTCLVLTYLPSNVSNPSDRSRTWNSMIELAQLALAR